MVVSEEMIGRVLVLKLAGSLDEAGAPALLAETSDHCDNCQSFDILFDLAHVYYLNHHGLQAILSVAQRLRSAGRRLAISGVQDSVFPVLEMNGVAGLILLVPDVAEGLAQFSRTAGSLQPTLDVQAP